MRQGDDIYCRVRISHSRSSPCLVCEPSRSRDGLEKTGVPHSCRQRASSTYTPQYIGSLQDYEGQFDGVGVGRNHVPAEV